MDAETHMAVATGPERRVRVVGAKACGHTHQRPGGGPGADPVILRGARGPVTTVASGAQLQKWV